MAKAEYFPRKFPPSLDNYIPSPENTRSPAFSERNPSNAHDSPARFSVEIERHKAKTEHFPRALPPSPEHSIPLPENTRSPASSERNTSNAHDSPARVSGETQLHTSKTDHFPRKLPPPPPPAPARFRASFGTVMRPLPLPPPSRPVVSQSGGTLGSVSTSVRNDEVMKPKLKPLHWDKVRASSDRVMVWDQLNGSFQLNEQMMETLFKANSPPVAAKDGVRRLILSSLNEESRVLDPKKSHNIAILLKALNVTVDEVYEALLEGSADTLGAELLESLLKMAPTKEEERKLKEYKEESPLKLGPAEKFLKAVIDVPFAFERLDAMLYMATFDSEVQYLRKSFDTLEEACEELRKSKMFLKLLEAVLKTGNRMNVGTNRGDAQAFKLDTLLKLVDVKGTDGKTTLLHFVVQEIIKTEGSRPSHMDHNPMAEETCHQPTSHDDIKSKKRGLEVIANLGVELLNVKKAAAMDSDALSIEVSKLVCGIMKVKKVLSLNKETGKAVTGKRFLESMRRFMKNAEVDIVRIQSNESSVFCRVKEVTEYFHGNMAKEEAHPLRIFTVVRDFLCVLDQVCKEVKKLNERMIISSAHPFPCL